MNRPTVSVIVPTYNRKDSLISCLNSLSVQSLDATKFEVIVVDDGSTDGTQIALEQRTFPFRMKLVRTSHGGPSRARNAGVAEAAGTFIAFTEDDVVVHPDWLRNALCHLQSGFQLVEGRTITKSTVKSVQRFERELRHSFIPCNLFINKNVFERVGGFDPTFYDARLHLYFREDADLGFRLLDSGCRTIIASDVVVEHPEQFPSFGACVRHVRRYVFDPLLYRKHPRRYRQFIEVKDVGRLVVRRPLHYAALLYLVMALAALGGILINAAWVLLPLVIMFACSMLFRFRYRGRGSLRGDRLLETVGFFVLPGIYFLSLLQGCWRFKSVGVLL